MGSFSPSVDGVQIKVVFIETQYINIDAVSFKSVVQRLTGKDSAQNLPPSSLATLSHSPEAASEEICWFSYTPDLLEGFGSAALPRAPPPPPPPPPVLDKLSSFRDFERMISQLPPMEDVYQFLDDL
ncbi:hypothetical protein QQ045_007241 [Rhodiola kirilowii]